MASFDVVVAAIITASLAIQVIVLALLIHGYMLFKRFQIKQHGKIMAYAVFLHLAAVFGLMIPSLVYAVIPEYLFTNPLQYVSVVGVIHAVLGSIALAMGVWLVVAWRFKKDFTGCFNRKAYMWRTFIFWVAALAFGLMLYAVFIRPLIAP
jgi:hypothetical protein